MKFICFLKDMLGTLREKWTSTLFALCLMFVRPLTQEFKEIDK